MTWQEDLRRLDEDFSSGQITADEYRVRRDQVLSSAVRPDAPQQPTQSDGEQTQIVGPVQPPPGQPEPPSPDATQVVNRSQYDETPNYNVPGDADQTQAVQWGYDQYPGQASPPAGFPAQQPHSGGFPAQQPPHSGGFPAQYPQPGAFPGHPSPPGGFPAQSQPAQDEPLWGGELPAGGPPVADEWITQGPDSFDEDGKGKTGRIIGGVVGVLVILGLAFGAWWLWLSDDGKPTTPPVAEPSGKQKPTTAPTTTPPGPETFGPIIMPEGETNGPATYSAQQLAKDKPLPANDLTTLKEYDVAEARAIVVRQGSTAITLWAFDTDDPKKLRNALVKDQKRFGFKDVEGTADDVPMASATQENNDQDVKVFRGHYMSGSFVIRVETFDKDAKTAREVFNKILSDQLDHMPAE